MILKSLKASNIFSLSEIELNFDETGLVLVEGWNYDDNTANGSGKSSIFNAICYCLYGKLPKKISTNEIVKIDEKKCSVQLTLTSNNKNVAVTRSRPGGLTVTIDGQDSSINQEALEILLGLNYEQFCIAVYSSQGKYSKFIHLNDSDKKDFFLNLMKLERFYDEKEKIDLEAKSLKQQLNDISRETVKLEAHISSLSLSLFTPAPALERTLLEERESLSKELPNPPEIPDSSMYLARQNKIENKKSEITNNINNLKQEISVISHEIAKLSDKRHSLSCPECGTNLLILSGKLSKHNTDAITKEIESLEQQRAAKSLILKDEIANSSAELAKLDELLGKFKSAIYEDTKAYRDAMEARSSILRKIDQISNKMASYSEKLTQSSKIEDLIKVKESDLASLNATKKTIEANLAELEAMSNILSPWGAPAYIMDSIIETFNDLVSKCISDIWNNASYALISHKELKNGDIRAKFSEKININGQDRSLGSLSGGELGCISIAIDIAIVLLLEQIFGLKISPIILDEQLDGLDTLNKERAMDLVASASKDRLIIVVDHASETKSLFSNVIRIEKRDGSSRIHE